MTIPNSAEDDLTVLLAWSWVTGSVPAVWYVFGDVILWDPALIQSTLVYEYTLRVRIFGHWRRGSSVRWCGRFPCSIPEFTKVIR